MSETKAEKFTLLDVPKALWYFLAEDRRLWVFFSFTLFLALFYELLPPYIIGRIVDFLTIYKPGAELNSLFLLVGVLGVSSALAALVRLGSKRMIGKVSINARYRAKVWGFERLLDFSLAWHQGENTGNKAQRIITGSEAIREWTHDINNSLFPTLSSFIGTFIACLFISPWFSFFFLYYFGVLVLIEIYFDRKISLLSDKINKSLENASGTFVEGTANILAVKALGAEKGMNSNVRERETLAKSLSHERIKLGTSKWISFQIHNSMAWAAFLLIVSFAVIGGNLSAGLVITYAMYFANMRSSATDFTDKFQVMIEKKSNLGRMMPFFWADNRLKKGEKAFPKDWDAIRFEKAVFRYKDKAALEELDLTIPKNSQLGIAGSSGSGKSTLIKLLLGLYHLESGSLKIGDTEIKDLRNEELSANISCVLQETELFNFSLRENIGLMRNLDPGLFELACKIACLEELAERLPEGYDTLLGEKGYSLSGGERQRVGIARAVCRNAPILLLDEATSALDSKTEKRVMEGLLGDFAKNKTLIVVAHRISTLQKADHICVFDQGRLVERGTYSELVADKTSRFGTLHALQSV